MVLPPECSQHAGGRGSRTNKHREAAFTDTTGGRRERCVCSVWEGRCVWEVRGMERLLTYTGIPQITLIGNIRPSTIPPPLSRTLLPPSPLLLSMPEQNDSFTYVLLTNNTNLVY